MGWTDANDALQRDAPSHGALTDRVKRKAVREFYRPFAARYPSVRNPSTPIRRAAMLIGGGAGILGALVMVLGKVHEVRNGGPDGDGELVPTVPICVVLLGAGILKAALPHRAQRLSLESEIPDQNAS